MNGFHLSAKGNSLLLWFHIFYWAINPGVLLVNVKRVLQTEGEVQTTDFLAELLPFPPLRANRKEAKWSVSQATGAITATLFGLTVVRTFTTISIHANSPRLSTSLPYTDRISRSRV